jgi:PAS domain S-box-containing protein
MNSQIRHQSSGIMASSKAWLASAAARLSHVRMAFVIVILLLAIALSTMVVQVNKQLSDLRGAPGDNANWNVLQVQTEFFRLQLALDRAQANQENAVVDLKRRAEVFASRVNLLQTGSSFNAFRGEAWFSKAFTALVGLNHELERHLAQGKPADPTLARMLDAMAPQVQAFASASVQALAHSADQQRTSLASLLQMVAALNTVMLLALAAAVLFLANQTRSLRQREQALAESEGRLAATVRAAHDAVIVHDQMGLIMEFNGAAERITGHARLNAIGKSFAELLLPPELRDEYARATTAATETGTGQRLELDVRHAIGSRFPADMALGATEGAAGKIFAVHLRDITRHREEAAALRTALEGAEEASQAKARFLAMMSHEIRTPLNGVLGALGLLEDTELASEQRLYVTTATRSGEALLNLISDILDLSKMEAGKLELDAVDFPFQQLLEDVRGILAPAAKRHANSFEVNIDPALPEFVTGDLGRLRQVLLNFGSNAVKFTTRGRVEITARIVGGTADVPEIEIAVIDTGIGIPRSRLDDLFQDFSMIDDSYQRKVGGTGLGLAISRRLVTQMRGSTGVESVEGLGSRFWFTVPLAVANAADESMVPPVALKPLAPMSILLVEDNPTNLMVASRILASEGHEVTTACDGCEAVDAVRSRSFDVVLMDISMPEMDGIEATRIIRSLPQPHCNVPIIAMTAHAISEDRQKFLAAGMDACLTKPIRRPQLHAALAAAAAGKPTPLVEPQPMCEELVLVDSAELRNLAEDMGPELMPAILAQFVDEILGRRLEAEAAAKAGAHEAFRKAVHAVSGSASTIGARRLANLAQSLERECIEGAGDQAIKQIELFSKLLTETTEALRGLPPDLNAPESLVRAG